MNTEEIQTGQFREDYYQDSQWYIFSSFLILVLVACLLIGFSFAQWFMTPKPVQFKTGDDFRVLAPVPINQPYIPEPNLIQWVSDALPQVLTVDFVNYTAHQNASSVYFTPEGWKKFQQVLSVYANPEKLAKDKLFVNVTAGGAPFILNQGLIQGSYGWWIQMPLNLRYSSSEPGVNQRIVVQALVVRVPTLDDLKGIKIDNMIVKRGEGDQVVSNE